MSINDYLNRELPPYYPTMYMDGYSPTQIYNAHRMMMYQQLEEQDDAYELSITGEVKTK